MPELFKIGPIPIRSFGVMLIIGFLVGYWVAKRRAPRFGVDPSKVADVAVFALLAGVIGARIGWVVQDLGYYTKNPIEILRLTEGGMTSYGGILFGFVAVWAFCKRAGISLASMLDVLAVPALILHGFGRIGCFLNGCCYGSPCELPWAVTVHPDGGGTYLGHPAQIYDTLMAFASAGLLSVLERAKGWKRGASVAWFFILYGISRFVYELFRSGYSSHSSFGLSLPDGQIVAAIMVAIGIAWFIVVTRRKT